jgi:hypothetical protein
MPGKAVSGVNPTAVPLPEFDTLDVVAEVTGVVVAALAIDVYESANTPINTA